VKVSTDDGGTRANGRCSYSILGTSNWLNFVPVELNEVHSLAGAQIEFFLSSKNRETERFCKPEVAFSDWRTGCFLKVWF
jgi:hypothetical protein